ncbi:MAG TPA: hypothetical protein VMS65_14465 [Polyangiaceae bacterium]|nr:hypothetical protein [Polyangiaceae bacterium]
MVAEVVKRRAFATGVAFLVLLGSVRDARSAVTQPPPDATPLPQPVPAAEIELIRERGFPESAATLAGLFAFRNDTLDPSNDATADPGTFRPRCPGTVTAEFVLHGGGCNLALAWYNATGAAPSPSDFHTLVPNNATTEMACMSDFCPLAGSSTQPNTSWTPRVYMANVCNDSAYGGGAIGFALVGDSTTQCSQTKYTERAANVACGPCTPSATWVTTLIYASRTRADAYFVAFEDLPMTPESWTGGASDGDFNDFVYDVTGVCHGSCGTGGTSGTGGTPAGGTSGSASGGTTSGGGTVNGGTTSGGGATSSGGTDSGGTDNGGTTSSGGTDSGGTDSGGTTSSGGTGEDGTIPCVPGRQLACACPDGSPGSQRCEPNGMAFEPCVCAPSAARDDTRPASGCGCRHGGRSNTGAAPLVALFALFALRRRSAIPPRRKRPDAARS